MVRAHSPLRRFALRLVGVIAPHLYGSGAGWFLLKFSRRILAIGLKNTTLTCAGKTDGGGAQIQAIVSVAALAKFFGAQFVHTPLSKIDHCPKHLTMEEFCRSWEGVISLFGLTGSTGDEFVQYDKDEFMLDLLTLKMRGKRISLENAHFLTDNHPEIYELVGLSATSEERAAGNKQNIYAHARRGDVKEDDHTSFRYTSDATLRANIETVRRLLDTDPEVFIVTQGPDAEFRKKFEDCTIIVEEDPVKAILLLANSDVLIMAKSSFSFVAGLLSKGSVHYETYWQRPLPSWSVLPSTTS
jgi:hypothetical protein